MQLLEPLVMQPSPPAVQPAHADMQPSAAATQPAPGFMQPLPPSHAAAAPTSAAATPVAAVPTPPVTANVSDPAVTDAPENLLEPPAPAAAAAADVQVAATATPEQSLTATSSPGPAALAATGPLAAGAKPPVRSAAKSAEKPSAGAGTALHRVRPAVVHDVRVDAGGALARSRVAGGLEAPAAVPSQPAKATNAVHRVPSQQMQEATVAAGECASLQCGRVPLLTVRTHVQDLMCLTPRADGGDHVCTGKLAVARDGTVPASTRGGTQAVSAAGMPGSMAQDAVPQGGPLAADEEELEAFLLQIHS